MQAVITGDIVQSTRMDQVSRYELLDRLEESLNIWKDDFSFEYEIFRGDSFQCFLRDAHSALRFALVIKCYIKSLNPSELVRIRRPNSEESKLIFPVWKFDARLAIGLGEGKVRNGSVGKSDGSAFVLSGHKLDMLKDEKRTIGIDSIDAYREELQVELVLLDQLVSGMSALQCEVVYQKLLGYTEMDISKDLGVKQSAVNQRSRAAGWDAIRTMVNRFENIYGAY